MHTSRGPQRKQTFSTLNAHHIALYRICIIHAVSSVVFVTYLMKHEKYQPRSRFRVKKLRGCCTFTPSLFYSMKNRKSMSRDRATFGGGLFQRLFRILVLYYSQRRWVYLYFHSVHTVYILFTCFFFLVPASRRLRRRAESKPGWHRSR